MKKVLFATTALVASAGIASAEVKLSGYAEIGLFDNGNGDMQFHDDMDVSFKLSGSNDNGLSFGAKIDLDEVSGGISNTSGPAVVNVSGAFGTVTMGDTDGAFDWALTETAVGGSLTDNQTAHQGYNGNGAEGGDGQVLRYNNTVAGFGFAVSMVQGDDGAGVADDTTAVGVKYSTDMGGMGVAIGLGTQTAGDANNTGASVKVTSGAMSFIVNASSGENAAGADIAHTGFGFGYAMNGLTVGVNWGENEVAGVAADGTGIAVNYDLGGGAVAQFGANSDDMMSLGLGLSF